MTSFLTSYLQSFGFAAAGFVAVLFVLVIAGLLETVRQEIKLKKVERERRRKVAPPRLSR
jgi:phosphotransferase system  glucose/maltose/N-acetylglucosamine-specific IIC component